jgi:endonuclease G
VTGGVLEPTLATIGKEKVAVPKLFYKIVLKQIRLQNDRVLIPNKESNTFISICGIGRCYRKSNGY